MPTPAPNSPEARRAARRVRDIFFFIAILNLVAVFVWMCARHPPAPAPPSAGPKTAPPPPVEAGR